jgi:hypothetical protein
MSDDETRAVLEHLVHVGDAWQQLGVEHQWTITPQSDPSPPSPLLNWPGRREAVEAARLIDAALTERGMAALGAVVAAGLDGTNLYYFLYHRWRGAPAARLGRWHDARVALVLTLAELKNGQTTETAPEGTVDLDQIAALCKLKKASMKPYKNRRDDPLPDPDIEGGGGKRAFWFWSTVRPWIVRNFPSYPVPRPCPSRG